MEGGEGLQLLLSPLGDKDFEQILTTPGHQQKNNQPVVPPIGVSAARLGGLEFAIRPPAHRSALPKYDITPHGIMTITVKTGKARNFRELRLADSLQGRVCRMRHACLIEP